MRSVTKAMIAITLLSLIVSVVVSSQPATISFNKSDMFKNETNLVEEFRSSDVDLPFSLTWTSLDNTSPTQIEEGGIATGDQVTLHAEFPNDTGIPELAVVEIEYGVLSGIYWYIGSSLVVPDASYDAFSGPVQPDQFAWERVYGIVEGDSVYVSVDFTNDDCDVMAWWADTDNTTWSYGNNLLSDQLVTGAHPEDGSFTATRSGSLMIGIFDYSLEEGNYTLTIDTRIGIYAIESGNSIDLETWQRTQNHTTSFEITGITVEGERCIIAYEALTFNNFFAPKLTSIDVTGDTAVRDISCTYTDFNSLDTHKFDFLLSADDGITFQLLALNLSQPSYSWDSTGFLERDTYVAKVRVYDNLGLMDEIVSNIFSAGTVPTGGPPFPRDQPTVSLNQPDDLTIAEGTIGHSIRWDVNCDSSFLYQILVDDIRSGGDRWWPGDGDITFSLEGLEPGTHEIMLRCFLDDVTLKTDSVVVTVITSNIPMMVWGFTQGITIGSLAIVVVLSYLILQAKRRNEGYWSQE